MNKIITIALLTSQLLLETKGVQIRNKDIVNQTYDEEVDAQQQVQQLSQDEDVNKDNKDKQAANATVEAGIIESIPGSHMERAKSDSELADQRKSIENGIKEKYETQILHHGEAHNVTLASRPDQSSRHVTFHLIPFSRTDLNFIKTTDEYYSGTNQGQQHASVRTILSGIVDSLSQNPDRRFSFAEVKYLEMWYSRQKQSEKDKLKRLVQNGQFEVVNGGWSSPDEACPSFEDLIDNMMVAHQFMQKEFGITPKIGWNIESWGHSSTNARLFSQMGYDAQFFGRVDTDLIDQLGAPDSQRLNFMWNPESTNFGDKYQILTHILEHGTYYPEGFYQDVNPGACKRNCGKLNIDPFVSDQSDSEYNAPDKSKMFINYATELSQGPYKSQNDIMIPMGGDFTYENTQFNFRNMESMMNFIKEHYRDINMDFKFSTPSQYVQALKDGKELQNLAVYKGDFYPYIEAENSVWSGFFSSRPALKKAIKVASAVEHAQNKILAQKILQTNISDQEVKEILEINKNTIDVVSVAQDHSTISGDIREMALTNEETKLHKKIDQGNQLIKKIIHDQVEKQTGLQIIGSNGTGLQQCTEGPSNGNSTVKFCPVSDSKNEQKSEFLVLIYNPIGNGAQSTEQSFAQIKLPHKYYKSQLWNEKTSTFQDVNHDTLEQSHFNSTAQPFTDYEMYIPYTAQPNQVAIFKIKKIEEGQRAQFETENEKSAKNFNQQSSKSSSLSILGMGTTNEVLFSYSNPSQNLTQTFGFNLKKYAGRSNVHLVQQNTRGQRLENLVLSHLSVIQKMILAPEGVLAFKGQGETEVPQNFGQIQDQNVVLEQGQFIEQYTMKFDQGKELGSNEQAIVRVKFSPTLFGELIKFDVELSPLPFTDNGSRDVTVNWKMFDNFDPRGQFWTDSNELEMQHRQLDKKEWYKNAFSPVERIPKNYFPVDSAIAMRDMNGSNVQVTIMNDRPQGGSADLSDRATIELMQQRRLLANDAVNGFDESLNSTNQDNPMGIPINAQYNMQIFNTQSGKSMQRQQQIKTDQAAQYFFAFNFNDTQMKQSSNHHSHEMNLAEFPQDFTSFALQVFPLGKHKILMRIENLEDKFDDPQAQAKLFNLEAYAQQFWLQAQDNQNTQMITPKIREMNLNGVTQTLSQTDDKDGFRGISMAPISIRTFEIDFSQK